MCETSIALACCVKNEERFLPEFLLYHHWLGVERAFVFLDGCTDRSASICHALPWVTTIDLEDLAPPAQRTLDGIQSCAITHAIFLAQQEGWEWLIHIDPDEFLVPGADSTSCPEQGSLRALAERTPNHIPHLCFKPAELVPPQDSRERHSFYRAADEFLMDPTQERTVLSSPGDPGITYRCFLGHIAGKAMVRLNRGVLPASPHRFGPAPLPGHPPPLSPQTYPMTLGGTLLHYNITGSDHWQHKYGKVADSADHWSNGFQLGLTKTSWIRTATELSPEEASTFYREAIMLPDAEATAWRAKGTIQPMPWVHQVLDNAKTLQQCDELRNRPGVVPVETWLPMLKTGSRPHFIKTENIMEPGNQGTLKSLNIHTSEIHQGTPFHWTMPSFKLSIPHEWAGRWLTIDCGPLAGKVASSTLHGSWGLHHLQFRRRWFHPTLFIGALPAEAPDDDDYLLIEVSPARTKNQETRELGIPIFSLRGTPHPPGPTAWARSLSTFWRRKLGWGAVGTRIYDDSKPPMALKISGHLPNVFYSMSVSIHYPYLQIPEDHLNDEANSSDAFRLRIPERDWISNLVSRRSCWTSLLPPYDGYQQIVIEGITGDQATPLGELRCQLVPPQSSAH